MTIKEAEEKCRLIAKNYGYTLDVPVSENPRFRSTLGCVRIKKENNLYYPYRIEFSSSLLRDERYDISDTIKHEMAHYLSIKETGENHKHDAYWKKWARELGCIPHACIKRSSKDSNHDYKYIIYCSSCGKIIAKYKRVGKILKNPKKYRSRCCKANIICKTIL